MGEFLRNIELHEPLVSGSYGFMAALLVALAAGVALSIFCKVYYRAFALWGFLVGSLGLLFLWLILTVLALHWALVVAAGIALPIWILFYIDEQSIVTAVELEQAAIQRESELQQLFESDPEAARSMAETLNLGNDDPTGDWSEGSIFQGIPRRIVRNAILMLIGGYAALIYVAVKYI
jgi:hypothetical protein